VNPGASKAAAKRLISDIIKIKDSLSIIERMMNDHTSSATHRTASNKLFDIFENLDDMNTAYNRLEARLQGNVKLLTGHDSAAAALIQEVVEDEMQCLVFKCRAHLMRIHSKVQQAKFAAVPYERRISQSKPGKCNLTILFTFSYLLIMMQILNFDNKLTLVLQNVHRQLSKWQCGTIPWWMKQRRKPKQQILRLIYFHNHWTSHSFTIWRRILTCG
jgi:hypothetical protein